MHRLAVVASHPIQYQSPWFRGLASHPEIEFEALFCHNATAKEQASAGFGVEFDWDISLLDGYRHRFLANVATRPSIHGFTGLDTPEIGRIIEEEKYDAVIVNGWNYKSAWQTIRACWNSGTAVMVRSDSHLRTARSSAKQIAKWPFYRWFIPRLDACLPVGQWSHEYFLHYGANPEKVFIVPHVIDTAYFESESQRLRPHRNELRQQWGLSSDMIVFLFAGKFVQNKRPLDFLRAMKRLTDSRNDVAGLMVGDGPMRRECEDLAEREKLPVRFAGFLNQSRIAEAYVAADALVLPSAGETWGLVVNEAMTCGVPCFVSDRVGCGPDLIDSTKAGGVFRVGEIDELATSLLDFAGNAFRKNTNDIRRKAESNSVHTAVKATAAMLKSIRRKGTH